MQKRILPHGFSIQEMEQEDFWKLIEPHSSAIFEDASLMFPFREHLSETEKDKIKQLREGFKIPFSLRLVLMFEGNVAGWAYGYQDARKSYYMQNSAVLPQFRRQGLYSTMLNITVEKLIEHGFQKIWSRHVATNNSVLIPKLKYGFCFSGFELSDIFGTLIHLCYFPNRLHKKIQDFRCGEIRPDTELKKVFSL